MSRYCIDVKLWGTAYIEAETREVGSEVAHMEDMLELRAWLIAHAVKRGVIKA